MPSKTSPTLLVADDNDLTREVVVHTLEAGGLYATAYTSGEELLAAWPDSALVCVLDLRMKDIDGIECLREIRRRSPHVQVVLLTGVDDARTAVTALKAGAFDYLTKPFQTAELLRAVNRALQVARTARESSELRQCLDSQGAPAELIGRSTALEHIRQLIELVAPTEESVLLTGESGTGKTIAARVLHAASRRAAGPFISVSCPSLPRDLLESEMFGHEKGAFSGAIQRRLGRVELAAGGTLFLDEIAELPVELQSKLLTFLQERTFYRIGGETPLQADVRIIAATHQSLPRLCREGRFREDLFYRLNVVPIELPPLRARPDDIEPLATRFLAEFSRRNHLPPLQLTSASMAALEQHPWPGNIRELENTLARIATLKRHTAKLDAPDLLALLPPKTPDAPALAEPSKKAPATGVGSGPPFAGQTMAEIERRALEETLTACGQNRARAARMLGLSEKTVYNMIRRHSATTVCFPSPQGVGMGTE